MTTVFEDLSLSCDMETVTTLVGPSSCGKTTILRLIAGLEQPTRGTIEIGKQPVGYAMQQSPLLPWRTLAENAALGLELLCGGADDKGALIDSYFANFGLSGCQHLLPESSSGGMKQRVSLIRTLVPKPALVLLDEPFSSLDFDIKLKVQRELIKFQREQRAAVILVTHDIEDAIALSDKVVILSEKPTRIKREVYIDLGIAQRDPVKARMAPAFRQYFIEIWNELKYLEETNGC